MKKQEEDSPDTFDHPMTRRARNFFVETLMTKTPIKEVMRSQNKIRSVQEAITRLDRYIESYPDIAEKYNAREIIQKELACERQAISMLEKDDAVRWLAEWYGSSKKAMSYRYQTIIEEKEMLPESILQMEREYFNSDEIRSLYQSVFLPRPHNEIPVDYIEQAVQMIDKRIEELCSIKMNLIDELNDQTGEMKKIHEQIEKVRENQRALENAQQLILGGN